MIRVRWQEPSARHLLCKYRDADNAPTDEIREGELQRVVDDLNEEVRIGKITSVISVEPYDYAAWKRRAETATTAALKKPTPDFQQAIWADLKVYLIYLFRGKCAYCEVSFGEDSWGDVEHYRPKGEVTELDGSQVVVNGKVHPGYYWLAYEPTNLMPSCEKCNRAWAKMNQFPIDPKGKRASTPTDPLNAEEPLLLNPYDDSLDAKVHLRFETTHQGSVPGMVRPLTPRGEASVKAYHLNRPPLIKARKKAQVGVVGQITLIVGRLGSLKAEKQAYADGMVPFSAAVLSELEDWEQAAGVTISL